MRTQLDSSPLADVGYSKDQVIHLVQSNRQVTTSGAIISGFVHSGKSFAGLKVLRKPSSRSSFNAKRQRREIRSRRKPNQ